MMGGFTLWILPPAQVSKEQQGHMLPNCARGPCCVGVIGAGYRRWQQRNSTFVLALTAPDP